MGTVSSLHEPNSNGGSFDGTLESKRQLRKPKVKTVIKDTPKAEIRALVPTREKLVKSNTKRVPYQTKIIQYGELPDLIKAGQKQPKPDKSNLMQMQAMWKNNPSYPVSKAEVPKPHIKLDNS